MIGGGDLGPLKVRMSLEKDNQTACDLWWSSLPKNEKDRINEARKAQLLTLSGPHLPMTGNSTPRNEPSDEPAPSSSQPKRRRTPSTSGFDPGLSGLSPPAFQSMS